MAIEGGAAPSAALDARIHEALGWLVLRGTDGRMSMRSPHARQWLRMTQPTRVLPDAIALRPGGWHYGVSERETALAWCADPAAPTARYHECNGRSAAMAMTRASLYAQRALALAAALEPPAAIQPLVGQHDCLCGWAGPEAALRQGRCPDCSRQISTPRIPEHAHAS